MEKSITLTAGHLQLILSKLAMIEKQLIKMSSAKEATPSHATELLLMKLDHLTLKRHAVLTASLKEVSYKQIAGLMQCSETTVKLHLKAALDLPGIPDRTSMLASHKGMLDSISNEVYESRFGISKLWFMEDMKKSHPDLMAVLTHTKPSANQHHKETA